MGVVLFIKAIPLKILFIKAIPLKMLFIKAMPLKMLFIKATHLKILPPPVVRGSLSPAGGTYLAPPPRLPNERINLAPNGSCTRCSALRIMQHAIYSGAFW